MNPTRRSLVSLTAALALVAGLAGPAAANSVGVITTGQAVVGKNVTFCNHNGQSDPSGAGLGVVGINPGLKQAFYALRNVAVTVVNDTTKGTQTGVSTGTLNACGRLRWVGKVAAGTAVGAACGMSKGYHGKGRIVWDAGSPKAASGDYFLHDITWKTTAGGIIPFWASGQQGAIAKGASGTDLVTGALNIMPSCFPPKMGEGAGKTGGATQFILNGTFEVLNGAWRDPQNPGFGTLESPGICKNSGNPWCAYDTKKPQTPKQG